MEVWAYIVVFAVLVLSELAYFRIADYFNIIDKPNERSSHSKVVLRGGGVIYVIGVLIWAVVTALAGDGSTVMDYLPFLIGLVLVAGTSFVDDIHSLPGSVRLVAQFMAMGLMFWSLDLLHLNLWWVVILALVICVGIINVYNFMDGINGINGGYSLVVLIPLLLLNSEEYVSESLIAVTILTDLIFCLFNFRPKNKARCFAGDVGSVGIAFVILFILGNIIVQTEDVSYLVLLIVYGVDACLTIVHRVLLHENLGVAHRKHAYQLMANELGMSHVTVSLIYMTLQLCISLVFIYLIPDTVLAHWIYSVSVLVLLCAGYVFFMKKYYHLHEEYLAADSDSRQA